MSREYCKVLLSKDINPQVYSRDLTSPNVVSFEEAFPGISVQELSEISASVANWLVCTNIESHEQVCSMLEGKIYCEKPFSHVSSYDAAKEISMLMNRRYYYWVSLIKNIVDHGKIRKIIACIPEKNEAALISQSIHVIDLIWYLTGRFGRATKLGGPLPTYVLSTETDIAVVINMNYGSHENFSLRFYDVDGVVYEAKPIEAFSITDGMEVREPDDDIPVRAYRPITRSLAQEPSPHKPGLSELMDDLIRSSATRLPTLAEHREIHAWMEANML